MFTRRLSTDAKSDPIRPDGEKILRKSQQKRRKSHTAKDLKNIKNHRKYRADLQSERVSATA
jgi:hypothetical protein